MKTQARNKPQKSNYLIPKGEKELMNRPAFECETHILRSKMNSSFTIVMKNKLDLIKI
jgi:hypothetical protein